MIWKSFMRNYSTADINKQTESAYVSKVYKIDYLNRDDEHELLEAFIVNGDMVAREKLINANLSNVIKMARTLNGYNISFLDLIQEGNLGLVKALEKFILGHEVRFYTFAMHYIKSAMYEFVLKNHKIYNIATTNPLRKLFFNLRRYKNHTGCFTAEEINKASVELKVKPKTIRSMEVRLQAHSVMSLDVPIKTHGETSYQEDINMTYKDALVSETEEPEVSLSNSDTEQHLRSMLYASLKSLDSRSEDIVRRRWLDSEKLTLSVLSKEYGVSTERIRQIEAQALKRMRTWMIN